ncbi:MAG: hypothetical protein RI563_10485 [Thiohalophilus sp.]|uniref:hypothetical protein n=1 Tax=Thiohalophilus sp. TaxID=3028392 RepID=UPI00287018E6|nr:hypothetical protein [Thiohalophilus sp.]MDR9437302.1 hypothetical protein [Thiohalophilus sp.]
MLFTLKRTVFVALLVMAALGGPVLAQGGGGPLANEPELRGLLQQEMQALQEALATISTALPQGQWHTVAETAGQIHDSFILQQQLSADARKTLHQTLPEGFIRQDQAFHQQAKKLQHAAESRDAELSLFYYSKMVESCVSCHSRFATHRFPSLTAGSSTLNSH